MAQQNVPAEGRVGVVGPSLGVVSPQTWNWAAYDHRTLYESVHVDNDPGRVGVLAQEWLEFGGEMADSARLMRECLTAGEEGWQGESAESARGAIRTLADWSEVAALTAADLGERVGEQALIMAEARAAMPEPVDFDWDAILRDGFEAGGMAGFLVGLMDVKAKSDQATSAHQQAVRVMAWMEEQSRAVDAALPWFTPPPDPVNGDTPTLQTYSKVEDAEWSTVSEAPVHTSAGAPAGQAIPGVPTRSGDWAGEGLSDPEGLRPATTPAPLPSMDQPRQVLVPTATQNSRMPNLDAYQPGGTSPQGVLAPSSFTPPNPGITGGMSTVDPNRESWTAPRSSAGEPVLSTGETGGPVRWAPNRDGYRQDGTSTWNSRGRSNVPPPSGVTPNGRGGEGGRSGAGPRGSINLPTEGDPRNRMPYGPTGSGQGGVGQGLPRPGLPGAPGPATAGAGVGGVGGPARGHGDEDEEHTAKYVGGERFFEVSDADLAPAVIGGNAPWEHGGRS